MRLTLAEYKEYLQEVKGRIEEINAKYGYDPHKDTFTDQ